MHREAFQGMQERWRQVALPRALAAQHQHPRPSDAGICGLGTKRSVPCLTWSSYLWVDSGSLQSCPPHTFP